MNAILRILNRTGIQDFDLSKESAPITAQRLIFTPSEGGWRYQSPEPVTVNQKPSEAGIVQVGDAYLVDYATRTRVLVLPLVRGRRLPLAFAGELSVGRAMNNALRLEDGTVSSHHCVFFRDGDALFVRDCGSTNGTSVNDRLIAPGTRWPLAAGDTLKLGRYTLRFERELCLLNADAGVHLQPGAGAAAVPSKAPAGQAPGRARPAPKPYPWFSRAPRMAESLPPLSIQIEDAPAIGEKPSLGMSAIAMSIPAMAISFGMTALRYGLGRRRYNKAEEQRADLYTRYLTGIEDQLTRHADRQRELAARLHPALRDCLARADGPAVNLWERHPGDEDFLSLRLGTAKAPAAAQIQFQPRHLQMKEDEYSRLPEQVAAKYAEVADMPVCCELLRDGICGVIGPRGQAVRLVQSMAAQLAALHSYDEVRLVVLFPKEEWGQWSWMRWLPHCMSEERDLRTIACTPEDAQEILPPLEAVIKERINAEKEWKFGETRSRLPHYLFIVADPALLSGSAAVGSAMMMNRPDLGLNGIIIGQSMADFPHSVRNILRVSGTPGAMQIELTRGGQTQTLESREHEIPIETYRVFARKLAPVRLAGTGSSRQQGLPSTITLFEGLGIHRIEALSFVEGWRDARPEETMAVPIGVKSGGDLFEFDIHERAQGPHGLVAGGTGSGKSKMVQSWVASMAMRFSPEDVNFILVDFKGESLVAPFRQLPHLAGFTSNIDPDVRRKFLAFESEMSRRMVLLKTGGEKPYDDIIAYRRARRRDPSMEPMPFLFMVVDEFAAFREQYPEFIAPIDHLYQAGRSLGMMAILMTQNPAGKVTSQMEANMGFSWCLRVKEESDSREVIGNGDAAHLRSAGRAYVKAKDGTYELIQSLFGMAPYEPDRSEAKRTAQVFALKLNGQPIRADLPGPAAGEERPAELEVLSRRIAECCREAGIAPARPIWRDPLPNKLDLEAIEQRAAARRPGADEAGFTGPRALLGLLDDPARQLQKVWEYDFWARGNLAVYGASITGKTTFLQTLLVSLCRRYHPDEVQFYLIDQGSRLCTLEHFPHVGGAAADGDPQTMERILRFLLQELDRRRKLFRKAGVGSPEGYAERMGRAPTAIFLLADHLNLLGDGAYELQNQVAKLAVEGPAYAIYTVCAFSGAAGVNTKLRQAMGQVVALRLSDKFSYNELVGKTDADPETFPVGRGLVRVEGSAAQLQTAIYCAKNTDGQRAAALQRLADTMRAEWDGPLPVPVRTVPDEIPYGSLAAPAGGGYLLGMDLARAEPVSLSAPENSLIFAAEAPASLRSLLRSLVRQTQAQQGEVWLCCASAADYADLLDEPHLLCGLPALEALVPTLRAPMQQRSQQRKGDPQRRFAPMLLLVEDLRALITQAALETTGRLEAFVRIGREERLGFWLVGGGDIAAINQCRYTGSSTLAVTLCAGGRLILGGSLAAHQLIDTIQLRAKHPEPLAQDEGCLLRKEGAEPVMLRMMRGDPDE